MLLVHTAYSTFKWAIHGFNLSSRLL
jgi:hypothetical protein